MWLLSKVAYSTPFARFAISIYVKEVYVYVKVTLNSLKKNLYGIETDYIFVCFEYEYNLVPSVEAHKS